SLTTARIPSQPSPSEDVRYIRVEWKFSECSRFLPKNSSEKLNRRSIERRKDPLPMLSYALKRIIRSWKLYASLILGMMLAATFFGGINVGADTIGKQALDAQLADTPVDISLNPVSGGISAPRTSFDNVAQRVQGVSGVVSAETVGSVTEQFYPYNGSIPYVKAIRDSSILYQHLTLLNGRKISSTNESVINADSQFAQTFKPDQTVKYSFGQFGQKLNITLKVLGEVQLDTVAVNNLGVRPNDYGPL